MSILDASVVLKWFIPEKDFEKADIIRTEYLQGIRSIIVPDLLLYEISNSLRYHPEFTSQEIKDVLKTLLDMEIEIITPTLALMEKAIDISKEQNITCYDVTYLALADDLQEEFITADEKLIKKLSNSYQSFCKILKNIT
jgi:predicted nucleic acid-binding protein